MDSETKEKIEHFLALADEGKARLSIADLDSIRVAAIYIRADMARRTKAGTTITEARRAANAVRAKLPRKKRKKLAESS